MKPRIAILISGSGTNMTAIAEAVASGELDADIVFVGSDKEEAVGLEKARRLGLETKVFSYGIEGGRAVAEKNIIEAAGAASVDWIVLAGYMRILSPTFVKRFADRIINIHPSLLPAFPGAHAIDDALDYGVNITGVTIHVVDELVDHGRILAQQAVEIDRNDTKETLEAKIHKIEHALYKATLKKLFNVPEGI